MRLLFDQNLPPRLVRTLADVFPGSEHVVDVRLDRAPDTAVARHAEQGGLIVVSKDADFAELAQASSEGLKVIWLKVGNCTTSRLASILRSSRDAIAELDADPEGRVLLLE